jgi:hypothetical protein
MAIVVQSNRFVPDLTFTSEKIGPGAYQTQDQFEMIKENFVGFNSKAERELKKHQKDQVTPGPGTYEIITDPYNDKVNFILKGINNYTRC